MTTLSPESEPQMDTIGTADTEVSSEKPPQSDAEPISESGSENQPANLASLTTASKDRRVTLFAENIYVISDLHLGDGTRSDPFCLGDSMTKRDMLRAVIREVQECDGHLIVAGDLMDLHQGWSIDRVITANAILFRELSDLGKLGKLTILWSELDDDINYYAELLHADVVERVYIPHTQPHSTLEGPDTPSLPPEEPLFAEIVQGFRFNPSLPENIDTNGLSSLHTNIQIGHHLLERLLGTWIRFPLENFYTLENRLFFWGIHALTVLRKWMGNGALSTRIDQLVERVFANQTGDPHQVWQELNRKLQAGEFSSTAERIIMGHSHLPGVVSLNTVHNQSLINTGSWLFDCQTVLHLQPTQGTHRLFDWKSKEDFDASPYQPLLERTLESTTSTEKFQEWWNTHYLGWLRFRF